MKQYSMVLDAYRKNITGNYLTVTLTLDHQEYKNHRNSSKLESSQPQDTVIIWQLSIKINWTNNQQNLQNLPNNLLVDRVIITLAKGWSQLSTTNDRSWNQDINKPN